MLETDYLVVGAGLSGLAFTDALIEGSDASVVIVDRNHAPGGHWGQAYPFVRLHQPSRLYGVASMPFGGEHIVSHGIDQGLYERASGAEIVGYMDRVMQQRLLPSGQVRYLPGHEYLGERQVRCLMSGQISEVKVRRRVVDATYLESRVPATSPAPFEVADDARCVPAGEVAKLDPPAEGYVIIGAGKTAMDTCQFLLQQGIDADRIRWIRPRDPWLLNRDHYQGGKFLPGVMEGMVVPFEAAAEANGMVDFFDRCGESGAYLRLDPAVRPTMIRGATSHAREMAQVREIRNVVRLGHVQRIERDRIVLEQGEIATSSGHLHVHCAAYGVPARRPVEIFQPERITLQYVRHGSPSFSAALIGFIEASDRDDVEKRQLAPPNALTRTPLDWIRALLQSFAIAGAWSRQPDIAAWLEATRLNLVQGLMGLSQQPGGPALMQRFAASVGPGLESMQRMLSVATEDEKSRFWPPVS